jgi:hypothetical protein
MVALGISRVGAAITKERVVRPVPATAASA